MKLSLFLALRYLRARQSSNAIHLLSRLSVLGMALGSAALLLVMSVFNGFETLVFSLTNTFNPDITITPARGKTFDADTLWLDRLRKTEGVAHISLVLVENALFAYKDVQDIGMLKGVDDAYTSVSQVSGKMLHGEYLLENGGHAVVGAGLAAKLGVDPRQMLEPLVVYMPNRRRAGPLDQPFQRRYLQASGIFAIQPEIDMEYVLTDLEFVQRLTSQPGRLSAVEIAHQPGVNTKEMVKNLAAIAGEEFEVKDRMAQEATFLKVMNMEKWVAFAIMCLIMTLVAFNVAGTLWMIVTEKKPDIAILRTMGASESDIRRTFLFNGIMLCVFAFALGAIGAILFYLLQANMGLIPVPPGFIIDAYPMELRAGDFFVILLTVVVIGTGAAWLPARRAAAVPAIIQEE